MIGGCRRFDIDATDACNNVRLGFNRGCKCIVYKHISRRNTTFITWLDPGRASRIAIPQAGPLSEIVGIGGNLRGRDLPLVLAESDSSAYPEVIERGIAQAHHPLRTEHIVAELAVVLHHAAFKGSDNGSLLRKCM